MPTEPAKQDEEDIYANATSDGYILVSELQYLIQEEKLRNPDSPFATEFQVNDVHFTESNFIKFVPNNIGEINCCQCIR